MVLYFSPKVNDDCIQLCGCCIPYRVRLQTLRRRILSFSLYMYRCATRRLPYIVVDICGFANNTVSVSASRTQVALQPPTLQKLSLRRIYCCSCCITRLHCRIFGQLCYSFSAIRVVVVNCSLLLCIVVVDVIVYQFDRFC